MLLKKTFKLILLFKFRISAYVCAVCAPSLLQQLLKFWQGKRLDFFRRIKNVRFLNFFFAEWILLYLKFKINNNAHKMMRPIFAYVNMFFLCCKKRKVEAQYAAQIHTLKQCTTIKWILLEPVLVICLVCFPVVVSHLRFDMLAEIPTKSISSLSE